MTICEYEDRRISGRYAVEGRTQQCENGSDEKWNGMPVIAMNKLSWEIFQASILLDESRWSPCIYSYLKVTRNILWILWLTEWQIVSVMLVGSLCFSFQAAFYCMLQSELTPEEVWNLHIFYFCAFLTPCLSSLFLKGLDFCPSSWFHQVADQAELMGAVPRLKQRIAGKSLPMEKYACRKAERWHSQDGRWICSWWQKMASRYITNYRK